MLLISIHWLKQLYILIKKLINDDDDDDDYHYFVCNIDYSTFLMIIILPVI